MTTYHLTYTDPRLPNPRSRHENLDLDRMIAIMSRTADEGCFAYRVTLVDCGMEFDVARNADLSGLNGAEWSDAEIDTYWTLKDRNRDRA